MAKPSKTISVNGEDCVTTADAAARLEVSKGRVLHFIHEQRLRSIQLEENGAHYIPIVSLEEFAKLKRLHGRPKPEKTASSKKTVGKKVDKKMSHVLSPPDSDESAKTTAKTGKKIVKKAAKK